MFLLEALNEKLGAAFYLDKELLIILAGKFSNLINVWSLIRPCGLEFFWEINRRVDMLIRATRVNIFKFFSHCIQFSLMLPIHPMLSNLVNLPILPNATNSTQCYQFSPKVTNSPNATKSQIPTISLNATDSSNPPNIPILQKKTNSLNHRNYYIFQFSNSTNSILV